MSVPDSTVMTDANGNPLTGTLTTHMTYYSDSLQAYSKCLVGSATGSYHGICHRLPSRMLTDIMRLISPSRLRKLWRFLEDD